MFDVIDSIILTPEEIAYGLYFPHQPDGKIYAMQDDGGNVCHVFAYKYPQLTPIQIKKFFDNQVLRRDLAPILQGSDEKLFFYPAVNRYLITIVNGEPQKYVVADGDADLKSKSIQKIIALINSKTSFLSNIFQIISTCFFTPKLKSTFVAIPLDYAENDGILSEMEKRGWKINEVVNKQPKGFFYKIKDKTHQTWGYLLGTRHVSSVANLFFNDKIKKALGKSRRIGIECILKEDSDEISFTQAFDAVKKFLNAKIFTKFPDLENFYPYVKEEIDQLFQLDNQLTGKEKINKIKSQISTLESSKNIEFEKIKAKGINLYLRDLLSILLSQICIMHLMEAFYNGKIKDGILDKMTDLNVMDKIHFLQEIVDDESVQRGIKKIFKFDQLIQNTDFSKDFKSFKNVVDKINHLKEKNQLFKKFVIAEFEKELLGHENLLMLYAKLRKLKEIQLESPNERGEDPFKNIKSDLEIEFDDMNLSSHDAYVMKDVCNFPMVVEECRYFFGEDIDVEGDREGDREMMEMRNKNMANRIDEDLKQSEGRGFYAAGYSHLFGEKSIPTLLLEKGWILERV